MTGIGLSEMALIFGAIVLFFAFLGIILLFQSLRSRSTAQHGGLVGLENDDHLQYMLSNGSRPMSGHLDLGHNQIHSLAEAMTQGQAVPFEQSLKAGDAAGGDLSNTYPDPRVVGLLGNPISSAPLSIGGILVWNGTQWEPRSLQDLIS